MHTKFSKLYVDCDNLKTKQGCVIDQPQHSPPYSSLTSHKRHTKKFSKLYVDCDNLKTKPGCVIDGPDNAGDVNDGTDMDGEQHKGLTLRPRRLPQFMVKGSPSFAMKHSKRNLLCNYLKTKLGRVSSMVNESGGVRPPLRTIPSVGSTSSQASPASIGKYKTFRVLYVPDPSRERDEHPGNDLGWVTRNITLDQYKAVKHLTRACMIAETQQKDVPQDEIRVDITEWLWTMLCMSEHKQRDSKTFNISYMNWTDFKMIACSPSQHTEGWNLLGSMDCIVGGLDDTIGVSLDDRSDYGLDENAVLSFESNMKLLGTAVKIWPPKAQVQLVARKQQTAAFLDEIAAAHCWNRPYTRVIHDGEPIPVDGVLKRSHSDCGDHVLLPEVSVPDDAADAAQRKIELAACRTWDSIKELTTSTDQTWICQEYIPTLLKQGEWRFFLVGEQIVSTVHTVKDIEHCYGWIAQPVTSFYTKREIRDIWAKYKRGEITITDDTFVNPSQQDHSSHEEGAVEMYDFVGTVFHDLAVREGKVEGICNSMSVFCRIDIGLMFDEAGEPSYFVNEIERTTTASLWLRTMGSNDQTAIVDAFSRAFHMYLSHTDS